jgi:hypothetical protein
MTFDVTLSQLSTKVITVNYSTTNNTAIAPSDYVAISGVLTFKAGTLKQNVAVTIVTDKVAEPDEIFHVILINPVNAQLAKSTGIGTILNDDGSIQTKDAVTSNVEAEVVEKKISSVRLWPNPASDVVNLQLYGYDGNVNIQLLTLEGKILQQQKTNVSKTGYAVKFDVASYTSGTYLITITDEKGNRYTEKVIVVK